MRPASLPGRPLLSLLALLASASACNDADPLPPPPVEGPTGDAVPPIGGAATTAGTPPGTTGLPQTTTLDGSGTLTTTATATSTADSNADADPNTGPGGSPLVIGQLLDGGPGLLPNHCRVRLHALDSIDPGSGIPFDVAFETILAVPALPQPYAITGVPSDVAGPGDQLYVSVLCDVDGDGALDDYGAYYPQIPLEPVLLPAEDVDLRLDFIEL